MRTFLFFLFAIALTFPGTAQKMCGTDQYQETIRKQFPQSIYRSAISISPSVVGNSAVYGASSQQVILIPVVVHVLYTNDGNNISESQIQTQLDILNRDFNMGSNDIASIPGAFQNRAGTANIRFQLAKVDPDGKATNGITRKKSARELWANDDKVKNPAFGGVRPWDRNSYLNLWVCTLVPGLLGYASAPGSPAELDGVVIRNNVFGGGSGSFSKGRTAVHEIGHWLNLKHLWGTNECGSDEVADTPPQRTYNQGCPSFPRLNTSCNNGDPVGEMFMNFMDFTDDACMMMFTQGQVSRMRTLFEFGAVREAILHSKALGEPWNTSGSMTDIQPDVSPSVSVSTYPNPATDQITLEGKGTMLAGKKFSLYSIDGNMIMEGTVSSENQKINLSHLRPGLFFIKLSGLNQAIRFIKQ
jgi:hypothetical protein